MTTDLTNIQLNTYNKAKVNLSTAIEEAQGAGPSFLTLTNLNDFSNIKGVVYADDVISGAVEDEINKTQNEGDNISSIIDENKNGSVFDSNNVFTAKTIEFESYEESIKNSTTSTTAPTTTATNGAPIKTTTNKNNLYKNVQLSNNYSQDVQKKIIQSGIDLLIDWLDDYINNYDERVAEGKENGESEVKLSFLLRLRKAIENCDFPIGFGNDDYFTQASGEGYVVLGAYSAAYNTSYYLNPEDHANDNVGALNHVNRSILLNAGVFCINRKYTSEYQVQKAIERGEFDYLRGEDVTQEEINQAYLDVIMASDETYYNYASVYFASILAHELIHSTHITNEAVTYNTCELIEDDFRDQVVASSWTSEELAAVDSLFVNANLNNLTYGEIILPTGDGGGLGFHNLGSSDDVASHGHDENMAYNTDTTYEDGTIAYKAYTNFATGNTLDDDKKELLNFIV